MKTELTFVPATLLVADDDPDDRYMILRALRRSRESLSTAAVRDGVEVMAHLQHCSDHGLELPRLVLLDLNMPRMDGREVLCAMKAEPVFSEIPVVVLTTSIEVEDLNRAYADGAVCFISKPEEFSRLVSTMTNLIDRWIDCTHPAALEARA